MRAFKKTYRLEHPLSIVYTAWLSNDTVIPPASKMQINGIPGGAYRLFMPDGAVMEGVFSEVVPNERLRYSWRWQGSDEMTDVEVRFNSLGVGTELRIEHKGFQTESSLENHSAGWDGYIEGLQDHLNNKT